jgi:hypothetical protein
MKILIISLISALSVQISMAQTIYFDEAKSRVVVDHKMTDLGKTKEEIYTSLKYFVSQMFQGGSAVIDLDDYDKGLIITRATYSAPAFPTYDFNIILKYRDNELMYTMSDISTRSSLYGANIVSVMDKEKDLKWNRKNIMRIAFDIKDGINSSLNQSLSDDW